MLEPSIKTNSQGVVKFENLQHYVDSMVLSMVFEGKSFDSYKANLKWLCEEESLDYTKFETDMITFFEILDIIKTSNNKLMIKLAEEKGRECHKSENTLG